MDHAECDLGRDAEPEQQQDHRIERDLRDRIERRRGAARRLRRTAGARRARGRSTSPATSEITSAVTNARAGLPGVRAGSPSSPMMAASFDDRRERRRQRFARRAAACRPATATTRPTISSSRVERAAPCRGARCARPRRAVSVLRGGHRACAPRIQSSVLMPPTSTNSSTISPYIMRLSNEL